VSNSDTYITFLGVELQYSETVLTPRLETEMLVLWSLQRVSNFEICIDIGTGSGAIALSVAVAVAGQVNPPQIYATDLSKEALSIAEKNALRTKSRVDFRQGDLLEPLLNDLLFLDQIRGKRVLILANLPYIPEDTILPIDVTDNDPALALWGWKQGTELTIRLIEQVKILSQISQVSLACEVFEGHPAILSSQYEHQMSSIVRWNDQCGIERYILFTYPHVTP
jgi:release factor glutamine methyltransferase